MSCTFIAGLQRQAFPVSLHTFICRICKWKYLYSSSLSLCVSVREKAYEKIVYPSWPISSKHSVNGRYAESLHLPRCCWHSNVQRLPDLSSQSSLSVLRLLWRSRAKEGSYLKYKNRQTVEFFYSSAMTGTIIVIKWPFPEQSNNSAIITGEVQHVFFVCVLFLTAKKIKFLSFQLFLTYDETWRNLYSRSGIPLKQPRSTEMLTTARGLWQKKQVPLWSR